MSEIDAKLDPRSLTVEERAIVDTLYFRRIAGNPRTMHTGDTSALYGAAFKDAESTILARRALFGSPASEPAKVECCLHCGGKVAYKYQHLNTENMPHVAAFYTCEQPAPPEPAAKKVSDAVQRHISNEPDVVIGAVGGAAEPAAPVGEMPEAVHDAIEELCAHALMDGHEGRLERASESNRIGKALESWWRTHARPVANVAPKKLEKVRIALDTMRAHFEPNCQGQCRFPMVWTFCAEAIAELDAYERGGREGK